MRRRGCACAAGCEAVEDRVTCEDHRRAAAPHGHDPWFPSLRTDTLQVARAQMGGWDRQADRLACIDKGGVMPFCRECGAAIDPAAKFCAGCGKPQQAGDATTSAASVATSGVAPAAASPLPEARSDIAGAVITIFGGVLLVLSAFLPWMSAHAVFASVNRNAYQLGDNMGFSADGLVLTLLGLVAVLIGITRSLRATLPPFVQRSPIIIGIVAVIVPLARVGSINDLVQQINSSTDLASASVGFGLWLAVFAGVITVVGGLALRSKAPVSDASGVSPGPSGSTDEPVSLDVVITSLGSDPDTIARIVRDHTGASRESTLAALGTLPATVLQGVGFATAEGVRRDIAARQGNQVTVVPTVSEQPVEAEASGGSDDAVWASAADPLAQPPGPVQS